MAPSADNLLAVLPPFNNRSILIESAQDVPDIMREVVSAHEHFARDYDTIWKFFYNTDLLTTCQNLFNFCKRNIRYVVESENSQTTKSPSAILSTGEGDCKHFAGFIAGILSAIERGTGQKINWRYRFASYDWFDTQPGHVFVVVSTGGHEYWIDPVLNYFDEKYEPVYITDKKIKNMPLYRMSGFPHNDNNLGFIDPEVAVNVITSFINIVKGGDQVPNYPVKSQATLDSLKASIAKQIPLPPRDLADAQRILAIAYHERELSVARGTDRATLTAIQLTDEIIDSLKYYIQSHGGNPNATVTELTAGANTEQGKIGLTPLLLVGGGAVALWLYSKRRSRKKVTGFKGILPKVVAGVIIYKIIESMNKPAPVSA